MMPDPRIAELEAELAALQHVPEPEVEPEAEVATEPEPEPVSMYATSLAPADALASVGLSAGGSVGGHLGLSEVASNARGPAAEQPRPNLLAEPVGQADPLVRVELLNGHNVGDIQGPGIVPSCRLSEVADLVANNYAMIAEVLPEPEPVSA